MLSQHAAHKLRAHPPAIIKRAIVECGTHVLRQLTAQPLGRWHHEAPLPTMEHEPRHVPLGDRLQHMFGLIAPQPNGAGNRRGVFDKCVVEEWGARFEAVRHTRAIGLCEELVREVRPEVPFERAVDVVDTVRGIPDRAIHVVRLRAVERGEERRLIRLAPKVAKRSIVHECVARRPCTGAREQSKPTERAGRRRADGSGKSTTPRRGHGRAVGYRGARQQWTGVAAEQFVATVAIERHRHPPTCRLRQIVIRHDGHIGQRLSVVPDDRGEIRDERWPERLFVEAHPE